jgi:dihydroflavonol-4-reductase
MPARGGDLHEPALGMTISLVTGGSGFIGQHLVDQLVDAGERVRVLDIEPPAAARSRVEFIQGSVTDRSAVRMAMDGVRHVYHTAAIPHLWIADTSRFEETNVIGTRTVFEQALAAGAEKVVHTSSALVLVDSGDRRGRITLDEGHQTCERSLIGHYARSKWRAEAVARSFADKLPVVVVMPTLPLGPGDHHFTPPSRMLLDFVNGKNLAYADCILNIMDVRDVAVGHRLACARGRPGQRYILNRHSIPMAAFLQCLQEVTDRDMPTWRVPGPMALVVSAVLELWSGVVSRRAPMAPLAGVRAGLRPIMFDGGLAHAELGLPTRSLSDTLRDAVTWLAGAGHLSDDLLSTRLAFSER